MASIPLATDKSNTFFLMLRMVQIGFPSPTYKMH